MHGCGYLSQFGMGSFILFPDFIVQVDDSTDNLVTFKSTGRKKTPIDYKEPKLSSARPAHVIPQEENEMMQVQFSIPDPKARPLPKTSLPTPTPQPSQSPDVIPEEDLLRSAIKPLSKRMLSAIHDDVTAIPPVPPSYTPAPAENTTQFDALRRSIVSSDAVVFGTSFILQLQVRMLLFSSVVRHPRRLGISQQLTIQQKVNHSQSVESTWIKSTWTLSTVIACR